MTPDRFRSIRSCTTPLKIGSYGPEAVSRRGAAHQQRRAQRPGAPGCERTFPRNSGSHPIWVFTITQSTPGASPLEIPASARLSRWPIDREILVEKITRAGEVAAYSLVPPGTSNYDSGPAFAEFKDMSKDERMAKAKALLEEAGFGPDNPLEFTLSYNTSENHKKVAIAVASMWKPLGVRANLFNTEVKVPLQQSAGRGISTWRGQAGSLTTTTRRTFCFCSRATIPTSTMRSMKAASNDELMGQAALTVDLVERAELLRQAEAIAMAEMPYIPIYYYVSKNLVKNSVKGWEDNVKDVHPSRFLSLEE